MADAATTASLARSIQSQPKTPFHASSVTHIVYCCFHKLNVLVRRSSTYQLLDSIQILLNDIITFSPFALKTNFTLIPQ